MQATLRNRSSMVPEGHGQVPRSTRFISLTCLVCQTLVYRVKQVLYATADGGEGPILPGDDWAEQDLLMSASGWVEVSKICLVCGLFRRPVRQAKLMSLLMSRDTKRLMPCRTICRFRCLTDSSSRTDRGCNNTGGNFGVLLQSL